MPLQLTMLHAPAITLTCRLVCCLTWLTMCLNSWKLTKQDMRAIEGLDGHEPGAPLPLASTSARRPTFKNEMAGAQRLHWLDESMAEVLIGVIKPGDALTVDTRVGHTFVAGGQIFVIADEIDLRIVGAEQTAAAAHDEL